MIRIPCRKRRGGPCPLRSSLTPAAGCPARYSIKQIDEATSGSPCTGASACFSLQKNASEQRAAGSEQLNFSRPFGGGGGHSPPAFVYGKSRNNVRRAANSSISQDRSEVGAGTARLLQSTEKCVRTTCGGQRTAQFLKAVRKWERARPACFSQREIAK